MQPVLVLSGLLMLLISAYLDNVRGPLMPIFAQSLNLSYTRVSLFPVLGSCAAVVSTYALLPLVGRFGEKKIALGVVAFGLLTIAVAQSVNSFQTLCAFALILGCTVAFMGAMCNLLVIKGTDHHRRTRFLSALHTMYGVGSLVGPAMVANILEAHLTWPWIFWSVAPGFVFLALLLSRLPADGPTKERKERKMKLGFTHYLILTAFSIYVAGECMTSMWMVTYLSTTQSMPVDEASKYLSYFFLVMAISRAACFFGVPQNKEKLLIYGSLLLAIGFSLLALNGQRWALPMVGIFGPYFPLLLSRMSRLLPNQTTQFTLLILTSVQLTLASFHLFTGKLADLVGMANAYYLPSGLLGISFLLSVALFRRENSVYVSDPSSP